MHRVRTEPTCSANEAQCTSRRMRRRTQADNSKWPSRSVVRRATGGCACVPGFTGVHRDMSILYRLGDVLGSQYNQRTYIRGCSETEKDGWPSKPTRPGITLIENQNSSLALQPGTEKAADARTSTACSGGPWTSLWTVIHPRSVAIQGACIYVHAEAQKNSTVPIAHGCRTKTDDICSLNVRG